MNKRTTPCALLALPLGLSMLLVSGSGLAAMAHGQQQARIETRQAIQNSGWANPGLAQAAAESGRALVDHLRAAKAFLADGSAAGARNELSVAHDFSAALERDMPFLEVSDAVRSAQQKMIAGNLSVAYDDLLPIYARLDDMQVYAPELARHVRRKVQQAEAQARSGKTRAAAHALTDVANEMETTTVYLPLAYVHKEIQRAQTALQTGHPDMKSAQKSVNNALGSLVAEKVRVLALPKA